MLRLGSILFLAAVCLFGPPARAGEPLSAQITLTSPLDYQVFQRPSRATGQIVIEGSPAIQGETLNGAAVHLQYRLSSRGLDQEVATDWKPLPYDSRVPRFRLQVATSAGGWYRLEVRAAVSNQTIGSTTVEHVGVGEIFVVAGQSNSANHGESKQQPESGMVVCFSGEKWDIANDPQPGASGAEGSFLPALGDELARHCKVPIGFISTGAGGTSVREWLPRGSLMSAPPTTGQNTVTIGARSWACTGQLYNRLADRTKAMGLGGFRAVLWHQGESDNHQPPGRNIPPAEYIADLRLLIKSFRTDIGWPAPWFVAQTSYHVPTDMGSAELREAQKEVTRHGFALLGPNTDTLGPEFRELNGQGVHFNARGLERHGQLWAEKIIPWLDGCLK